MHQLHACMPSCVVVYACSSLVRRATCLLTVLVTTCTPGMWSCGGQHSSQTASWPRCEHTLMLCPLLRLSCCRDELAACHHSRRLPDNRLAAALCYFIDLLSMCCWPLDRSFAKVVCVCRGLLYQELIVMLYLYRVPSLTHPLLPPLSNMGPEPHHVLAAALLHPAGPSRGVQQVCRVLHPAALYLHAWATPLLPPTCGGAAAPPVHPAAWCPGQPSPAAAGALAPHHDHDTAGGEHTHIPGGEACTQTQTSVRPTQSTQAHVHTHIHAIALLLLQKWRGVGSGAVLSSPHCWPPQQKGKLLVVDKWLVSNPSNRTGLCKCQVPQLVKADWVIEAPPPYTHHRRLPDPPLLRSCPLAAGVWAH